jgi:RNA polymerase sigma-70 factor, ECF subfamily
VATGTPGPTESLLRAAQAGDEDAFRRLVEPHRGELHAHCYRMLGSVHDAEDALQETLLRAWKGLSGFAGGRPLRPWLYRIATNVCLDAIAKRPRRALPADHAPPSAPGDGPGEPTVESIWLEPYPDGRLPADPDEAPPDARYEQREAVELAFVAALQHLPANQRAVLILRDVLGFSAREAAEALDTSVASVNSAVQRARTTAAERLPARSQQATLRELGDERVRAVVEDYVAAWERRDVQAMVALLAEDVTFAMPPHPHWFRGRDAVVEFIAGTGTPDLRRIVTTASGQPAIAWYLREPGAVEYAPASIEVLGLEGARVREITAFAEPDLFGRLGLPARLEDG